jgi:hypothetical protein
VEVGDGQPREEVALAAQLVLEQRCLVDCVVADAVEAVRDLIVLDLERELVFRATVGSEDVAQVRPLPLATQASRMRLKRASTRATRIRLESVLGRSPTRANRQALITRSNCSVIRPNSGGVIQLAFIHVRSSSVAPRATAQPCQM